MGFKYDYEIDRPLQQEATSSTSGSTGSSVLSRRGAVRVADAAHSGLRALSARADGRRT